MVAVAFSKGTRAEPDMASNTPGCGLSPDWPWTGRIQKVRKIETSVRLSMFLPPVPEFTRVLAKQCKNPFRAGFRLPFGFAVLQKAPDHPPQRRVSVPRLEQRDDVGEGEIPRLGRLDSPLSDQTAEQTHAV